MFCERFIRDCHENMFLLNTLSIRSKCVLQIQSSVKSLRPQPDLSQLGVFSLKTKSVDVCLY